MLSLFCGVHFLQVFNSLWLCVHLCSWGLILPNSWGCICFKLLFSKVYGRWILRGVFGAAVWISVPPGVSASSWENWNQLRLNLSSIEKLFHSVYCTTIHPVAQARNQGVVPASSFLIQAVSSSCTFSLLNIPQICPRFSVLIPTTLVSVIDKISTIYTFILEDRKVDCGVKSYIWFGACFYLINGKFSS